MAISLPNTIENDSPADGAELQQNFTALQSHINTNLLDRSGSVAMTGPLTLEGDPTQPNHAVNKEYVDGTLVVWNPVFTGLVKGSGTQTAHYLKAGRQCMVTYRFIFGAGSTCLTHVTFTLPFEAMGYGFNGSGYVFSPGSGAWPISVQHGGSKSVAELNYWSTTSYGQPNSACGYLGLGDPTWKATDEIAFEMTYLTAA